MSLHLPTVIDMLAVAPARDVCGLATCCLRGVCLSACSAQTADGHVAAFFTLMRADRARDAAVPFKVWSCTSMKRWFRLGKGALRTLPSAAVVVRSLPLWRRCWLLSSLPDALSANESNVLHRSF